MLSNLLLLKYNNYYDRKFKKEDNLEDYMRLEYFVDYARDTKGNVAAINFNPNDGITTTQVVMLNELKSEPNYCIVLQENEIASRWFVMDLQRTREGQYNMILQRDVIADSWDKGLTQSDIYCKKGMIADSNDLIYNSEPIALNQIKWSETKLLDKTSRAWIVGYLANMDQDIEVSKSTTMRFDESVSGISNWPYYQYINLNKCNLSSMRYKMLSRYDLDIGDNFFFIFDAEGYVTSIASGRHDLIGGTTQFTWNKWKNWCEANRFKARMIEFDSVEVVKTQNNFLSDSTVQSIIEQDGKIILDSTTNKYYKVEFHMDSKTEEIKATNKFAIFENVKTVTQDTVTTPQVTDVYYYIMSYSQIYLSLTEVQADSVNVKINKNCKILSDSPYRMFAIPYGAYYKLPGQTQAIRMNKQTALNAAFAIGSYGTSVLYDIQLLPYCPCTSFWNSSTLPGFVDLTSVTLAEGYDYDFIKNQNNQNIGAILYCEYSSFSFKIMGEVGDNPSKYKYGKKEQDAVMKHRICSPNYNGQFEFSKGKNGGYINYYSIDCAYKPYAPYIHIAPSFGGLYHNDYGDARGLVCGGDFSVPTATDAWKTYEVNNKNYQNQFDRQIETVELQNKFAMLNDVSNAVTGTISGAISGTSGGVAGSIAGAALSAVGGAADIVHSKILRDDQLSLQKDMFNMNLQNIQAMPYSLSKVSSFNPNNKIFPFVELYRCSEDERIAFEKKIEKEGMTVEAIGTILDFIAYDHSFFKGQLIHTAGELGNTDAHYIDAINQELMKGIYVL